MSESKVVTSCIRWLSVNGCEVWRNNTGGLKDAKGRFVRFGLLGSADILGLTPSGRFLAVECKYGDNDLSDHQKAFGERIKMKNGIYIVAYSLDDLEANRDIILA